ncbi:MAG: NAD(+) synthase [Lachnospiraceae bacterium]|nr:NAD(+) synthase [Lachnospiraceae bacterium]
MSDHRLILIMGTFNPPTKAHVAMGTALRERFPEADICYLPSADRFGREWKGFSGGEALNLHTRAELLRGAVPASVAGVSEVEGDAEKTDGRTYNTARWFREHTGKRIVLAIGADQLGKLGKWYMAEDLAREYEFVIFTRSLTGEESKAGLPENFTPWKEHFTFLEFPYGDVSSTRVREAYLEGRLPEIRDLVPENVYRYLEETKGAYWRGERMYEFDAKKVTEQCITWIREFFAANGPECNAVLGISGGKDSTVAAALCAAALGKDRVIGVLMPNDVQPDIDVAREVVRTIGIRSYEVNIKDAYQGITAQLGAGGIELTDQARINLAPRLRMATVYAVSQCYNGRVVNTCNLSEDWVGYSTRYGDAAGDFSPMAGLTVAEVKAVGAHLDLPAHFTEKAPSDGLCGRTDEDNLGFTYAELDRYIRTGEIENAAHKERIDTLHARNLFKMRMMPSFHWTREDF